MLTMPLGTELAAACIASPRRCTTSRRSIEIRAGEDQGAIFPHAQPRRRLALGDDVGRLQLQGFQGGQTRDKKRRLADDGGIELLDRPFKKHTLATS